MKNRILATKEDVHLSAKKLGKRLLAAALCGTVAFQGIPATALAAETQTLSPRQQKV